MSGHYWKVWNRAVHQFGVSYADTAEEAADNLGWAPSDCAVRSMAFPAPAELEEEARLLAADGRSARRSPGREGPGAG